MPDSQHTESDASSAHDQPVAVPDWLVEAYAESDVPSLEPDWYDPEQVALAESFEHQWWQDEQDIREPVIEPLPVMAVVVEEPTPAPAQDLEEVVTVSPAEPPLRSEPMVEIAEETDADSDLPAGDEESRNDFTLVSPGADTIPLAALPQPDTAEIVEQDAATGGILSRLLRGRRGAAVDASPEPTSGEEDGKGRAGLLSRLLSRRTGKDSSAATSRAGDEAPPAKARFAWPAALSLAEGPKDDPYRPRFAVAPSSARSGCVLLWILAGANVVAAAVFVTLALSAPGSLSLPTLGSIPTALLWLGVLVFSGLAVAAILGGQGIARGYRTWQVIGVTVSVCTVWMPLVALPSLYFLTHRTTRDWVI